MFEGPSDSAPAPNYCSGMRKRALALLVAWLAVIVCMGSFSAVTLKADAVRWTRSVPGASLDPAFGGDGAANSAAVPALDEGLRMLSSAGGPGPPYARTGFAYGISKREAVLIGFVNARGVSTTARFQVGRTKSYGRWFPAGPPEQFYSGHHSSEIEQGVDGLRPGATYHFRLVATNVGGTTHGKDKTFRTLPR
jgi:hypothetical protein